MRIALVFTLAVACHQIHAEAVHCSVKTPGEAGDQQKPPSGPKRDSQPSSTIEASADEITATENETVFQGSVEIISDDIQLTADKARYNAIEQSIELDGNIQINSDEASLSGSAALYNLSDGSNKTNNASYLIKANNIRGTAAFINTDDQDVTTIEEGSYTQCDPEQPTWAVKAKKIVLDPVKGQGKAKHATLSIYNAPIFYLPYAQFPIGNQRQSGFLFPRLADTNSGFDVSLPYYLNIAPNFDITLSPRFKEEHGYVNEGQMRWLNRFDQWSLDGSYIDSDQSFNDRSRWAIKLDEDGQLGEHITTRVRYNDVSDADFLRDLNTASFALSRATYLTQSASARYLSLNWDAGLNLRAFRELNQEDSAAEDNYEQLPSLWLNYESSPAPFRPVFASELRHSELRNKSETDGSRSYGGLSLKLPMPLGNFDVEPRINYQHRHYVLDEASTTQDDSRTLDIGTASGELNLATTLYQSHGAISNTITPQVLYQQQLVTHGKRDIASVPQFDTSLASGNLSQLSSLSRFEGLDAVEELEQIAFILNRQRYNRHNGSLLDISLGQKWYLDRVDQADAAFLVFQPEERESSLITELNYSRAHLKGSTKVQWDADTNKLHQAYAGVTWRDGSTTHQLGQPTRHLLNLSHSFRDEGNLQIEQANIAVVSYLNQRWGLFGQYQFDFENHRHTESLAGIEYNSCCVRLRLVYRDGVVYDPLDSNNDEYDRNIFLQIELKGLMSLGRSVENALEEAIDNFKLP